MCSSPTSGTSKPTRPEIEFLKILVVMAYRVNSAACVCGWPSPPFAPFIISSAVPERANAGFNVDCLCVKRAYARCQDTLGPPPLS